jgi:predicted outer membrane repeat protein
VAASTTTPNGGGFQLNHVTGTISDTLVIESDALGSGSGGGAGRVIGESVVTISDSVFARNSAVQFGGALYFAGSDVDVTGGAFLHNSVTGFGSALFVTGQENFPTAAQDLDAFGAVSSVLFADNSGGNGDAEVWDDDSDTATRFYNDVRYNSNTFWPAGTAYGNSIAGTHTAASLNGLVVNRANFPDTDKSQNGNSAAGAQPVVAFVRAVPPTRIAAVAAGDTAGSTQSFAGLAWTGGSATFDGNPVTGNADLIEVGNGTHTLAVGATQAQDQVAAGPVPAATLTASPSSISSGQSSTLTWATTAGTDVVGALDQGLDAPASNDGSEAVTPPATTDYTFLAVTRQGGAAVTATVLVDEVPLDSIFEDGFESGNTGAWSDEVP